VAQAAGCGVIAVDLDGALHLVAVVAAAAVLGFLTTEASARSALRRPAATVG
jgi:hypothetical protein